MNAANIKSELERAGGGCGDLFIVYDGECIFCNAYVRLIKLRDSVGRVVLIDARTDGVASMIHEKAGVVLDDGMLVLYGNRLYYGPEAINILSMLSDGGTRLNRATATVLKHPRLARAAYPALKIGRRLTLWARGKTAIGG